MNEIKLLLDKYLDGTTTLAEEEILMAFFKKDEIPEEFSEFKSLFSGYDELKQARLNNDTFEEQLLSKIENTPEKLNPNKYYYRFAGIAATLIISISLLFVFEPTQDQNKKLTESEMELLRKSFNKITESFERAERQIAKIELANQSLEKLDKISYYEKYNNMIYKYLGKSQ